MGKTHGYLGAFLVLITLVSQAVAQDFRPSVAICDGNPDFSNACTATGLAPESEACTALKTANAAACDAYMSTWYVTIIIELRRAWQSALPEVIAGFFGIATVALTLVNQRLRLMVRALKARLVDPFLKTPPRFQATNLNVLLVGEGGVGKTSVIRAASGSPYANPDIATKELITYSIANEVTIKRHDEEVRNIARIYIDDYVGQDISTLFQSDYFSSGRGKILRTIVVIVVDLFYPDSKVDGDKKYKQFDKERIDANIGAYNDSIVRLLTAALPSQSRIILFINKIDKMVSVGTGVHQAAIEAYDPLIRRLERVRGASLSIIVGSAKLGTGIVSGDPDKESLYSLMLDSAGPARAL